MPCSRLFAFFASLVSCALLTASLSAQTPVGTITVGPPPNANGLNRAVINPASNKNKTYLFGTNSVDVIDLALNRLVTTIALPVPPPSASFSGPSGAWVNTSPLGGSTGQGISIVP